MIMTIAVITGVTGFLGSRLAKQLVAQGNHVIGLKRASSSLAQIQYCGLMGKIEWHDIPAEGCDLAGVLDGRRADVLFHTAALARTGTTDEDVAALVDSNLKFPLVLAQQAKRAGVRVFINASTSWQSTDGVSYSPFNIYAATKEAFENLLVALADENFACVSIRLFDTYGAGDYRGKIVDLLVKAAATGQPLAMSPGGQFISLLHADDAARAFIIAARLALAAKGSRHHAYAAPADTPIRLRDLADLIERLAGKPVRVEWGGRPYRPNEIMMPNSSCLPVPGWTPQVPLEQGLKELIDTYRTFSSSAA